MSFQDSVGENKLSLNYDINELASMLCLSEVNVKGNLY